MNQQKKQAFTLVELIVVIIILSILGTIAFLTLQGYSRDARDSTRTSDMASIKSSLELFHVDAGKYPDPTEAQPVTYTGGLAWYQGIFGNSTFINVDKLDDIPVDPLTEKEYSYSVLNNKQEFELGGIIEGEETALLNIGKGKVNSVEAAEKTARAKLSGTYNGLSLRINTNGTSYILAIPSITTSIDLTVENNRKLETIIPQKEIVLENYKNLPSNYINSSYDSNKETTNTDYKIIKDNDINNALVYEGDVENLTSTILVTKLQEAYSGTTTQKITNTKELLSIDTNNVNQLEQLDNFGVHFINNHLGGSAQSKIYATCGGIAHNTTKSYYSSQTTPYPTTCDTVKKDFICKDGTWKDGTVDADLLTYQYTTCSELGALNCDANATYTGTTTHTYNITALNHNDIQSFTSSGVSENNGVFTYTTDVICDNGTLSNTAETGPTVQSCDTNYSISGNTCVADTQTFTCASKPTNTIWNTVGSYTQTWSGTQWLPADSTPTYSLTGSTTSCNYICDINFHTEDGGTTCTSDTRSCTITNGIGQQTWNGSSWNTCTLVSCNAGYLEDTGACRLPTSCEEVLSYSVTSAYSSDVYDVNTGIAGITKFICNNGWTLISSQDLDPAVIGGGLFTDLNEAKYYRENDPNHARYSILNQLENFRAANGTFTFKLEWPDLANKYNEWTQTSNPMSDIDVTGYNPIHIDGSHNGFGGLELTDGTHLVAGSNSSLLDGSVNHSNWYYGIGQVVNYINGVIPSDMGMDPGQTLSKSYDLWVKESTPTYKSSCNDIFTNHNVYDINGYNSGTYYPQSTQGRYRVDPDNNGTGFDVACDMLTDGGGWTVLGMSYGNASGDTSTPFDVTWNTIKNTGVGTYTDLSSNYFMPLETYRKFANAGNQVNYAWFGKPGKSTDALQKTLEYSNHYIDTEANFYTWYGTNIYSIYAYATLAYPGMKLTTNDVDNDTHATLNCSVTYSAFGWYSNCHNAQIWSKTSERSPCGDNAIPERNLGKFVCDSASGGSSGTNWGPDAAGAYNTWHTLKIMIK